MKVTKEISLRDFEFWSGGEDFANLVEELDKWEALENALTIEYPDGIDETELNDLFRFEGDYLANIIGYADEFDMRRSTYDEEEDDED